MTTKSTFCSHATLNSFLCHCKRCYRVPEGVAFIYYKLFQRVWHDLPESFTNESTLIIKTSYRITLCDFLDIAFLLIYGFVLTLFLLIEPSVYSKLNWIHIGFYIAAMVSSVGCTLLIYILLKHKQQLEVSFNALVYLKKRLDRGIYYI